MHSGPTRSFDTLSESAYRRRLTRAGFGVRGRQGGWNQISVVSDIFLGGWAPVLCACRRENFAIFRCRNAKFSTISMILVNSCAWPWGSITRKLRAHDILRIYDNSHTSTTLDYGECESPAKGHSLFSRLENAPTTPADREATHREHERC